MEYLMFPDEDDNYDPDIHLANLQHISKDVIDEIRSCIQEIKSRLLDTNKVRSIQADELKRYGVLKKIEDHDDAISKMDEKMKRIGGLFSK
jgi:rRNA-processing protein FCF1